MGINIGICETEAPSAPCRELRANIVKVHLDDPTGYEKYMERDVKVDLETARQAVGDWDAFIKRNRINPDTDAIYIDKVKKEEDRAVLEPLSESVCTGWIATEGLPGDVKDEVISKASPEDRLTGWDMLSFDEMNEIAGRHGCGIVASVPDALKEGRRFTPEDAKELLREVEVLRAALPEEGKMMVRRYSGPVDRMEAVAKISVSEGCGFFFF